MGQKDKRSQVLASGAKDAAGRMNVRYRAANGHSFDATVVSAGSSSGLKLRLGSNSRILDNIAAATSMHDVNVYFTVQ